jgi:hypothetical protein
MGCLNDHFFTNRTVRAEQERYARGWDPRSGKVKGGITFPIEDKVDAQRTLFRFGHGRDPDEKTSRHRGGSVRTASTRSSAGQRSARRISQR